MDIAEVAVIVPMKDKIVLSSPYSITIKTIESKSNPKLKLNKPSKRDKPVLILSLILHFYENN